MYPCGIKFLRNFLEFSSSDIIYSTALQSRKCGDVAIPPVAPLHSASLGAFMRTLYICV